MGDPEDLCWDLERMIDLEGRSSRGNPGLKMGVWLEKLVEAERMRSGF
jgi:hypothetical protein